MSHETIGQLLTALLVLLGTWFSARNGRAIKENTKITKETHEISNGSYTLLLQEKAELARELSNLTGTPEHLIKALMAEKDVSQRMLLLKG